MLQIFMQFCEISTKNKSERVFILCESAYSNKLRITYFI